jgi:hypothetical protein
MDYDYEESTATNYFKLSPEYEELFSNFQKFSAKIQHCEDSTRFKLSPAGESLFESPAKISHGSLSAGQTNHFKKFHMENYHNYSMFDSKSWDTLPKVAALSESNLKAKSGYTVSKSKIKKRRQNCNLDVKAKIRKTESAIPLTTKEQRQPLKVKFATCPDNGYRLVSMTCYEPTESPPTNCHLNRVCPPFSCDPRSKSVNSIDFEAVKSEVSSEAIKSSPAKPRTAEQAIKSFNFESVLKEMRIMKKEIMQVTSTWN